MNTIKAVIFDMDGVLIDSENFWSIAEHEIFTSLGVQINSNETKITKSMTTSEVSRFWYDKFPWKGKSLAEVEEMVISRVIDQITNQDCQIPGIDVFIKLLKSNNFKIALATNSPKKIIDPVINKLAVSECFDITLSADQVVSGKPDPAIYLKAAHLLQIHPTECLVVEDSTSGIQAAKNAGMVVAGFTNLNKNSGLGMADYMLNSFCNYEHLPLCFDKTNTSSNNCK
ncbi:HAD-IA family hydrolase [Belliella sp. DSM 111904]|uniref:HAD-IA family hydrolase n=1 Tax=Belliella filtrata TaxID=2923435 RepID=A0ABS9V181_9BACT|nr:HAD-IA family hydrolase [Belliella filtrata]MCH7410098.1 HAD-IA family hydrolase [Belliella filtrata]